MNVRPKVTFTDDLKLMYGNADDAGRRMFALGIECEVTHPPSNAGRTVYLLLDDADVVRLLRELRSAAIRARSKAMGA
jgi:hypothetical protein